MGGVVRVAKVNSGEWRDNRGPRHVYIAYSGYVVGGYGGCDSNQINSDRPIMEIEIITRCHIRFERVAY
jgi:hypothetical protein